MPTRPIMIAVGGDSGAGKSTLCRGLEFIFGADRIETICLDDYLSLDRAQRRAVGLTAADPRANNFAAMEEDLWALREGRNIEKPTYDHATGTFGTSERVEPSEILAVRGLFPLYTRALRSLFDVTVWLEPEPELQTGWKLARDTSERGYVESAVREELERRRPDVERSIRPQGRYADLTVTFYRGAGWERTSDPGKFSARIRKGGRFRPLDYTEFASGSTSFRQLEGTSADGYPETVIELAGDIDRATAESVEDNLWSHMASRGSIRPDRLGEFHNATGDTKTSYSLALAQLLIARRVDLIENELWEMVP